jgi:hypothetical protein
MHITISLATIKHFLHFLLCGKINNQIRNDADTMEQEDHISDSFFVFKMHLTGVNFLDDYYIDIW